MTWKTEQKKPKTLLLSTLCLVAALGLSRLPEPLAVRIRAAVLDSTLPVYRSRETVLATWNSWKEELSGERQAEIRRLEQELTELKRQSRLREIELAESREQWERRQSLGTMPDNVDDSGTLIVADLVRANVIGDRETELLQHNLLIERSSGEPIETGSLVLDRSGASIDRSGLLLDRGQQEGLQVEHPVYAGRCVVGRLTEVGKWMSRVQMTTNPDYRGRAQILRSSNAGFSFGPEGIIEGTGEGTCRLRYVGRTESVRVGDDVYTGTRSASLPEPMYYGRIVKAELAEAAREWTIEIEPAVDPGILRTVEILRQSINPVRVMAN